MIWLIGRPNSWDKIRPVFGVLGPSLTGLREGSLYLCKGCEIVCFLGFDFRLVVKFRVCLFGWLGKFLSRLSKWGISIHCAMESAKVFERCKNESRIVQRESWQAQMDLIRSTESEVTWSCKYSELNGKSRIL